MTAEDHGRSVSERKQAGNGRIQHPGPEKAGSSPVLHRESQHGVYLWVETPTNVLSEVTGWASVSA